MRLEGYVKTRTVHERMVRLAPGTEHSVWWPLHDLIETLDAVRHDEVKIDQHKLNNALVALEVVSVRAYCRYTPQRPGKNFDEFYEACKRLDERLTPEMEAASAKSV